MPGTFSFMMVSLGKVTCKCRTQLIDAGLGAKLRRNGTWKSSTEKAARPCLVPVSARSCKTCIATAVDDSAMPPPRMMAPAPGTPLWSSIAVTAIAAVVASTLGTATTRSGACARLHGVRLHVVRTTSYMCHHAVSDALAVLSTKPLQNIHGAANAH